MKKSLFVSLFILPFITSAQVNVSGRVVDEGNRGLPFASVVVKGAGSGTATDSTGGFSLLVNKPFPFTLSVSSASFATLQFVVKDNSKIDGLLIQLKALFQSDTVVITSRRRVEVLQDVPIPISVIGARQIDDAGTFNVNRVKEFVPSLQLYTSNPRNTGVNIRGLGSPFGLTNDGLDPGVGYYVDGVYYARPAAATIDFIDVERIEVLRGPQGTLFGKNTTSGAINISSRKPSFKPGGIFEVSYGNYGFVQAKSSITGPLSKKLAARLSFSGTQRNGVVDNIRTLKATNDINNLGLQGQLLFNASDKTSIILRGDLSRQRPDGYAQVVAGVVRTKRAGYRQFDSIIAALNYQLPSRNAFDRVIDHDTPWNSDNDLGGASLTVDSKVGPGTLTSTTAWRFWDWGPSNDRDFTGLPVLAKSQNPAKHRNWSQEIRYAGEISSRLSGVVGLFYINQEVTIDGTEESGAAQWRFSQSSTSNLWQTPGLFEGYGIATKASIKSTSAALFANADWKVTEAFHITPGIRFNYDKKDVSYNRTAYGGLQTDNAALIALKNGVYSSQSYAISADENNFTYLISAAYKPTKRINIFATYSTSFKPVGVNVAGLPTKAGKADTSLAVIKPEDVRHYELGIKSTPAKDFTLNVTVYNTEINDYQTNVQSPELGVNRGYIANAEKVRVRGVELDVNIKASEHFTFFTAASYNDGKYVRFTNAPLPLEETGQTIEGVQVAFKDISGGRLPGISKWSGSLGGEFSTPVSFIGKAGRFFIGLDGFYRSDFSSSPSPSAFLNVKGYLLANGRLGFKSTNGFSAFIWGRNIFNTDYFEQLLPAGGNAGHYAGVLGDPATYGVTLRYNF
ncbi:MAG TPA: TonB-dependent receptor [Ferruginibacter sp.]|nr:TonB-dependent receptor [Ferruginibacter sp.]